MKKLELEPPRFDWYQATVETSPDELIYRATSALANEPLVAITPRHGYDRGLEFRRDGARSAVLYHGGIHDNPHIMASGEDAPSLAGLLRGAELRHRVSRADVCVDTDTPGSYKRMYADLRRLVRENGKLSATLMCNPDDAQAGATYYVGSPASEVRARLYEKGKQMKDPLRPHWVRYEVQARPQRERKAWTSTASEWDILGSALWAREFARDTLALGVSAPPKRSERVSDLEGSLRALSRQYGRRLDELAQKHGGDMASVGAELLLRAGNQRGLLPEGVI
jgi:hypothetical protein